MRSHYVATYIPNMVPPFAPTFTEHAFVLHLRRQMVSDGNPEVTIVMYENMTVAIQYGIRNSRVYVPTIPRSDRSILNIVVRY
jgi:hypothetical protein